MAGHSKWANIRHRKAAVDAKKGKAFAKVSREITVAARKGGTDPEFNFSLRSAIERAKEVNFPKEKIKSAIQASIEGAKNYDEILYEGMVSGVGILIEILTDNRNRAAADVREVFTKGGGALSSPGSVAYQFSRVGSLVVNERCDEESIAEAFLEGDVEDYLSVVADENQTTILVPKEEIERARIALEKHFSVLSADLIFHATHEVAVNERTTERILSLLDKLDDLEDVHALWTNLAIQGILSAP